MNTSPEHLIARYTRSRRAGTWTGMSLLCVLLASSIATAHPMGIGLEPQHDGTCPRGMMSEHALLPPGPPPPPVMRTRPALESVRTLPKDAQKVRVEMPDFYFVNGLFFMEANGRYRVVPPPPGAIIAQLPETATELRIEGKRYYTVGGIFYQQQPGEQTGYAVVAPPLGPPPPRGHHHGPTPPPQLPGKNPVQMRTVDVVSVIRHEGKKEVEVVLKRDGHQWFGPAGEVYTHLPSESELVETTE